MPFVEIMNRILCEYGLWLKETNEAEPCRFAIMSLGGCLAYLCDEGEVTAFISALYAFRRGKIPIIRG